MTIRPTPPRVQSARRIPNRGPRFISTEVDASASMEVRGLLKAQVPALVLFPFLFLGITATVFLLSLAAPCSALGFPFTFSLRCDFGASPVGGRSSLGTPAIDIGPLVGDLVLWYVVAAVLVHVNRMIPPREWKPRDIER